MLLYRVLGSSAQWPWKVSGEASSSVAASVRIWRRRFSNLGRALPCLKTSEFKPALSEVLSASNGFFSSPYQLGDGPLHILTLTDAKSKLSGVRSSATKSMHLASVHARQLQRILLAQWRWRVQHVIRTWPGATQRCRHINCCCNSFHMMRVEVISCLFAQT